MLGEIRQIMRWGKGSRRKRIVTSILHVAFWPLLLVPRLIWPFRRARAMGDDAKILLIRMDGIGDLSMSAAAFSGFRRRYPRARIDVLTSDVATPIAQLYASAGWVNTVFTMPLVGRSIGGYLSMLKQFQRIGYDAMLDLRGDARTVLLMWLAGAPRRMGIPSGGFNYLLTDIVDLPQLHHQAQDVAEMVRRIGVAELDPYPTLPLPESLSIEADGWLIRHGVDRGRPIVAMHIGAFLPTKVWPMDRFLEVARRLRDSSAAQVLLVGGKTEVERSREFAAQFGPDAILAAGEASLPLTAAMLARCAVLIGNDSGPAHVAAYVGCPVVVLFGPGVPEIYRPLSPKVVIMRSPRPCEPNCERVCQRPAEQHCMLEHTADAVFSAAERLLRECPRTWQRA